MTTTPCPICETDADVLPIPDFDSEAFHCPAHGRFEVSRTAMMTHRQRHPGLGRSVRARPSPSPERQPAPHRGQRLPLKAAACFLSPCWHRGLLWRSR
jgi:hypothetical protein